MTHLLADLVDELATVASWLHASLLPGTHRPYRPELSADRKSELAVAARLRQREITRSGMLVPLGQTPAPVDVEILDLLFEIGEFAARHAGVARARQDSDDPRPVLHVLATKLRLGTTANPDLEDGCEDFITRGHQTLGLIGDGQLLKAVCPWCQGITASHPEGGQRTLRIRAKLPPGKKSIVTVDPKDVRFLVVCESGTCEPPAKDCGTWWHGRPAWDLRTEADWLAQRLERAAS